MTNIEKAPQGFAGEYIGPADRRYEAEREAPIRQFDRRPAAIACCTEPGDAALALLHARECGVEVAVRSGRHSVPGYSSLDGGLVIDVSRLKGVELDGAGLARVRPGMIAAELLPALAAKGLTVVGGSEPQPAFVGLAIHGGRGLLSRRHGWASDRIRAGRLITATGAEIEVSANENADLLFGLRGLGSNYGIVTELTVEPVSIPKSIRAGKLIFDRAQLAAVVPGVLGLLERGEVSDGLGVMLTFFTVGDGGILELKLVHVGSAAESAADLAAIEALGDPVEGSVDPIAYDAFITGSELPPLDRFHWAEQGSTLAAVELAAALLEAAGRLPAGHDPDLPNHYLSVEPFGPGFLREPDLPTPVPRRQGSSVAFFSAWTGSDRDAELMAWPPAEAERLRAAGVGDGIPILNYNSVTGPEGVRRAYGEEAYLKLARLKSEWDPDNVFRHNHNVGPG